MLAAQHAALPACSGHTLYLPRQMMNFLCARDSRKYTAIRLYATCLVLKNCIGIGLAAGGK